MLSTNQKGAKGKKSSTEIEEEPSPLLARRNDIYSTTQPSATAFTVFQDDDDDEEEEEGKYAVKTGNLGNNPLSVCHNLPK